MANVYIRNHFNIYIIVIDIIAFLNVNSEDDVNPTLEQFIREFGINDIHALNTLSWALLHLKWNNYIQLIKNDNKDTIIISGERSLPDNYNYIQYSMEIPIINF